MPINTNKKYNYLLATILLATPLTAIAINKKSTQLSSNSVLCTNKKWGNSCCYRGNAKLIQGNTRLQGDKITIDKVKTQDGDKIEKIVASGKNSSYSTITNDNKQKIDANADSITINPEANTITLENNGKLVIGKDTYQGPYIEYKFK